MKKTMLALLAFIVVAPLGAAQENDSYYAYSYARLSYVGGDVFVQRTSDLGYEKGEVNLALVEGDKLGTENGQAEVHFGRRNYLRVGDYSQVEFAVLPREGDDRIKLHVLEGSVFLRVSSLGLEKEVEIHTPDASFYILEEGLYRINVRSGRETEFFAHEGSAEAAGSEGSLLVRAQERISALDGRFLGEPEYFYENNDTLDEWNGSRDAMLAQRGTTRYLPSDLSEYEEELDAGGRWTYESPYGYVWVPYSVDVGWRPYLYGRWVWYPVIGWTWVSSESWGWAVYHYGRWHWRGGLGWYWIPHHHWRPAWVHWWWDRDYIGWCPLSWYNRPVVLVNNYFYDRHYDPYFPSRNRAMTVIHRNQLQASHVARHAVRSDALGSVGRIALKAQQPSVRPVVDKSSREAVQARKVLSRQSVRGEAKNFAPSSRVASGRSSPGGLRAPQRSSEISSSRSSVIRSGSSGSASSVGRASLGKSSSGTVASGEREVRTYPRSRLSSSSSGESSSGTRSSGIAKTSRQAGTSDSSGVKTGPAKQNPPAKAGSESSRQTGQVKKKGPESPATASKPTSTIKTYSSSSRMSASSLNGRSVSVRSNEKGTSPRNSTTYPSRIQGSRNSSDSGSKPVPLKQSAQRSRSQASLVSSKPSAARSSMGSSAAPAPSSSRSNASTVRSSSSRKASSSSLSSSSRSRVSQPRVSAPSQPRTSVSRPSATSRSSGSRVSAPRSSGGSKSSVSRSSGRTSSGSSSSSSSKSAGKVKKKD